jgi:hypothetical protein
MRAVKHDPTSARPVVQDAKRYIENRRANDGGAKWHNINHQFIDLMKAQHEIAKPRRTGLLDQWKAEGIVTTA